MQIKIVYGKTQIETTDHESAISMLKVLSGDSVRCAKAIARKNARVIKCKSQLKWTSEDLQVIKNNLNLAPSELRSLLGNKDRTGQEISSMKFRIKNGAIG